MKQLVFLGVVSLSILAELSAQTATRQQAFNLSGKHIAIEGYDPGAYFTQGKAVEGKASHAAMHDGVT
jgi:hypothetical protein